MGKEQQGKQQRSKCRKDNNNVFKKLKSKKRGKKHSLELQNANIEAEVLATIKNVTEKKKKRKEQKRKKKLRSLARFHSANKIDNYNRGGKKEEEKKYPNESTEQVKTVQQK